MATKVGINGFGRIGRLVFRAMEKDPAFDIVAINDPGSTEANAHLLKYDSIHGRVYDDVKVEGDNIIVDGHKVRVFGDREPLNIPWGEMGVELVIESTGFFTDANLAKKHIEAGAKKVLITAPAKNEDITIVVGVNDDKYDYEKHNIVSNASCTTNCLAPFAKVLMDTFGIKRGFMNTIHSYTNDQKILDQAHKDLRRARAANLSMIPTTTGAARAVSLVLPELKGKLDGFATRVPTPDGSMVDLTVELEQEVTIEEVNAAMKAATSESFGYNEDPIVSSDVIGMRYGSLFDATQTMVAKIDDDTYQVQVVSWYDNENSYTSQMVRTIKYFAENC